MQTICPLHGTIPGGGEHGGAGRTLVVGAGGRLGGRIAAGLLARGNRAIRLSARRTGGLHRFEGSGADLVRLDLTDPATFASALDGVDVVVATAHGAGGPHRAGSRRVDDIGYRRLIDACEHSGARRFVYVSEADA